MAACTRLRSSGVLAKATSISWGCGAGAVAATGAGGAGVCTGTTGADGLLLSAVKAMADAGAGGWSRPKTSHVNASG